jgi:hypothetical protein
MLKTMIINEKDIQIRYFCDKCKVKNSQIFKPRTKEYFDLKKLNSVKNITIICPKCNDSIDHSIINSINYKYNY